VNWIGKLRKQVFFYKHIWEMAPPIGIYQTGSAKNKLTLIYSKRKLQELDEKRGINQARKVPLNRHVP
jgi:hypothetical protein